MTPAGRDNAWLVAAKIAPALLLAVLAAAVYFSGLWKHLTIEELQARHAYLSAFVDQRPGAAIAIYLSAYIIVVSLSLPAALLLTLSGGFLFGTWLGGLLAVTGATVGSTVIYAACRTAFGGMMQKRAGPTLLRIEEGIKKDAFHYLLTLRLIPAFPLLVINLAAGLVGIRLRTFLSASFLGMAPSSLVYASMGAGLGHLFLQGRPVSLSLLIEPRVVLPLIGLGALAGLSMLYRHLRPRRDV
ncbi:VTT domain-containing protein [Caulobacter segnis]|uniref:TVP38/TMEM64 family protein n=1 Tax=Caulobacter segnis TaxID=88688 RepID=UPI00240F3293|nr:VTT domain-containing protein [Caulobacter segnis]MDG2523684.1 VTT domain-containing protein [Caulobacter segnis]